MDCAQLDGNDDMRTKQQAKEGFAKYLDGEIIGKTPGLRKWALAAAIAPLLARLDGLLDSPALAEMGYVTQDGMFDEDKARQDFARIAAERGSVTEHLPLVGDVTFSAEDVEKLWGCIHGQG